MPATYEPIATTTLGSAASSINFTSITSTYTDLRLVITLLSTGSTYDAWVRFNSDTGSNYSYTRLYGSGSAASSSRGTSTAYISFDGGGTNVSTTPSLRVMDVFSYAGSTNKSVLIETNNDKNGDGGIWRGVGLWRSTSAITSINIINSDGANFAIGSTATLYGILKA